MFSCSKATNEMNYMAQKFVRAAIGTNNIDSCNRTCTLPPSSVWRQSSERAAALPRTAEVEETDVIILWGSNARETHPIFFHHVIAGVRNGARGPVLRRSSPHQLGSLGRRAGWG